MADEYEILPHKKIEELRSKLEQLKRAKGIPNQIELNDTIDELNENIKHLISIFKKASEALPEEEKLLGKVEKLFEQNKQIAQGIVAVADMMNEKIPKLMEDVHHIKQMMRPKPVAPKPKFGSGRPMGLDMGMPSPGMPPRPSGMPPRSAMPSGPSMPHMGMPPAPQPQRMMPPPSGAPMPPPPRMHEDFGFMKGAPKEEKKSFLSGLFKK